MKTAKINLEEKFLSNILEPFSDSHKSYKLILTIEYMKKPIINYIVDFLMVVSFLLTAITALVIFFFLPSGVRQGSYQTFLGIIKGNWSTVHDWSGIIFIILALVHFVLHWKWVRGMTKNIFLKKMKGGGK